jgi:hypothetical protein
MVGQEQDLAAASFRIDHRDADDLTGQRPEAKLAVDFLAPGRARGGVRQILRLAEEIFLLHRVKTFQRLRCGFNVED